MLKVVVLVITSGINGDMLLNTVIHITKCSGSGGSSCGRQGKFMVARLHGRRGHAQGDWIDKESSRKGSMGGHRERCLAGTGDCCIESSHDGRCCDCWIQRDLGGSEDLD